MKDRITAEQYRAMQKPKKKPTAKWQAPKLSESQQQAQSVAWFRQQYPQFARLMFSVPNGGFRSKRTAAIIKREGAVPGIPDICLAVPRKSYHALYLELKTAKGKPTENQIEVMQLLSEQGYCCKVVYSIDEFKETVINYLKAA